MYSFNQPRSAMMQSPERSMSDLKSSLAYKQGGTQDKERYEKLMGMGLPITTDISRVQLEGVSGYGQRTYSAPRPMPFGGGGGGGEMREPSTPRLPRVPTRQGLSGGMGAENAVGGSIASGVAPTLGEAPLQFGGEDYSFTSPNMGMGGMGSYTPSQTMQAPSFGLGGSSLTSPLAGPSPTIPFPTREDEILNPYGLRNYRNY